MKLIACSMFLLLSFLTTSVMSQPGGQFTRLLDFVSMHSGRFTNANQVGSDVTHKDKLKHDILDMTFLPADIPALRGESKDLTAYILEKANDQVIRKQILIMTLNDEGVILIQPYDFKDPSRFGKELPDPADLANIKPKDLSSAEKECVLDFTEVSSAVFFGNWPDCNNKEVSYGISLTCVSLSVTMISKSSPEHTNSVPYVMQKVESFSLTDDMIKDADGWSNPCGKV